MGDFIRSYSASKKILLLPKQKQAKNGRVIFAEEQQGKNVFRRKNPEKPALSTLVLAGFHATDLYGPHEVSLQHCGCRRDLQHGSLS
jgi:hypothetical protein